MAETTACPPPSDRPQRFLAAPALLDPDGIRTLRQSRPRTDKDDEHGFCLINLPRLAELEAMYFPMSHSQLREATGSALCPEVVNDQIAHFLERIHNEWFPVLTDEAWSSHIEPDVSWALQYVPLLPQGVEYEHPDEINADGVFGCAGIVDLLMCLASREEWAFNDAESQQRIYEQMHATYPDTPALPDKFRLTDVVPLLEEYPSLPPFDALVAVCRLVLHETCNVWLDTSYSMYYENHPSEFWENMAGMQFLRDEWRRAQPIVQARECLEAWADAPVELPNDRHRQIVQLLIKRWEIRNGQMVLPLEF